MSAAPFSGTPAAPPAPPPRPAGCRCAGCVSVVDLFVGLETSADLSQALRATLDTSPNEKHERQVLATVTEQFQIQWTAQEEEAKREYNKQKSWRCWQPAYEDFWMNQGSEDERRFQLLTRQTQALMESRRQQAHQTHQQQQQQQQQQHER